MTLPTARRAQEIEPFEVMDVLSRAHALEAAGRHVIHMEIGEPDFGAPAPVVEAGMRALRDGRTAYTATLGLPTLREMISSFYLEKFNIRISPARIAITSGASGGLLTSSPRCTSTRATRCWCPIPAIPAIATSCARSRASRARSPCPLRTTSSRPR
jgi:aspartate/methionine/tyrosine aminotransferase